MNTRTNYHKRTVTMWVQVILANVLLIATLWYCDAHDLHLFKSEWIDWVGELHFLLRISIWMFYIIVIWYVIKVWYILCGWIARLLIKVFYK